MIRINLARYYTQKKTGAGRGPVMICIVLAVVLIAAGGSWLFLRQSMQGIQKKNSLQPIVSAKIDKTRALIAPTSTPELNFPDTAAKKIVPVQTAPFNLSDTIAKGVASGNLPLAGNQAEPPLAVIRRDTSSPQPQIPGDLPCELVFAGRVCSMLNRIIPAGISLYAVSMDSCTSIHIEGGSMCKDPLREMFGALKHEKVTILRPPHSFIKSDKSENSYTFSVECSIRQGFCADTSGIDAVHACSMERRIVLAHVNQLARKNHLAQRKRLRLVSTEPVNGYIRSVYHWVTQSSYSDFYNFVQSLCADKLPCVFSQCILDARSPSAVVITSQIVVTTIR